MLKISEGKYDPQGFIPVCPKQTLRFNLGSKLNSRYSPQRLHHFKHHTCMPLGIVSLRLRDEAKQGVNLLPCRTYNHDRCNPANGWVQKEGNSPNQRLTQA